MFYNVFFEENYHDESYQSEEETYSQSYQYKSEPYLEPNLSSYDFQDVSENTDYVDAHYVVISALWVSFKCHRCQTEYVSNNALHTHLHIWKCQKSKTVSSLSTMSKLKLFIIIIKSDFKIKVSETELDFWCWHYTTVIVSLSSNSIIRTICLDLSCTMTLIDRLYLLSQSFSILIHVLKSAIHIWEINGMHILCKYTIITLFVSDEIENKQVLAEFIWETHLIKNLWANLLLDTDIMKLE